MRRVLPAIFALLIGSAARAEDAFSQCWATSENNLAVETCLAELKREVDQDLTRAYAAALEGVAEFDKVFGDDRVSRALERAQKGFELFRDLDCDMHGMMAGSAPMAGNAFKTACWVDRSRERIKVLAEWRPVPTEEVLAGTWRVLMIGEDSVPVDRAPNLTFEPEGRVSGHGGCNRFFGSVQYGEATLRFGPLGGTRMSCGEAIDGREYKLMQALERVRRWSFAADGALLLETVEGMTALRLRRDE